MSITTPKLVEDLRFFFIVVEDRISIQNDFDELEKYFEMEKIKLIRLCISTEESQVHAQNVTGD